jgi:hypothetical protein
MRPCRQVQERVAKVPVMLQQVDDGDEASVMSR